MPSMQGFICLREKNESVGGLKLNNEFCNQERFIKGFSLRHDYSLMFECACVCVFFMLTRSCKVFRPPSCLHQGSVWSYCLNDEVLQLGLARTAPIVGLLPDSHLYWRLHKRLHRAEVRAEKKGRGLWKQPGLWERLSEAVSDSAFFQLMSRTFKRTWCSELLKPCQSKKKKTKKL